MLVSSTFPGSNKGEDMPEPMYHDVPNVFHFIQYPSSSPSVFLNSKPAVYGTTDPYDAVWGTIAIPLPMEADRVTVSFIQLPEGAAPMYVINCMLPTPFCMTI
jgi:hypothetical protein